MLEPVFGASFTNSAGSNRWARKRKPLSFFPSSLYDRLLALGWIERGMLSLDLGTGTGTLALGLVTRGLDVVGLDPSTDLLAVARRRASELGVDARFVEGTAEDTGAEAASFDLVTAGQCWWWFDTERAIAEAERVLKPEGRLLIANFCYLPIPGSVAGRTESLILEHNPGWPKVGESGIFESTFRMGRRTAGLAWMYCGTVVGFGMSTSIRRSCRLRLPHPTSAACGK